MKADTEDVITQLCLRCCEELRSVSLFLFTTTCDLVREAGLCHNGGAYVACAVICRGALESILHELRAWKKRGDRYYLDENYLDKSQTLEANIRWALRKKLLSKSSREIANHIRKGGNFAAHLREHIDREIEAKVLRLPPEGKPQPYRLWISEEESLGLLKDCTTLLVSIGKSKKELEMLRSYDVKIPNHLFNLDLAST